MGFDTGRPGLLRFVRVWDSEPPHAVEVGLSRFTRLFAGLGKLDSCRGQPNPKALATLSDFCHCWCEGALRPGRRYTVAIVVVGSWGTKFLALVHYLPVACNKSAGHPPGAADVGLTVLLSKYDVPGRPQSSASARRVLGACGVLGGKLRAGLPAVRAEVWEELHMEKHLEAL